MGNVHMEATQINYRGGSKKMSVEEAIKAAGTEITPEEKEWIDTIPELASQEIIAPEFDAEEGVYAIGDLVIYQGGLYQFTTAHETAGAWNAEEVAAVKISDELDSLKSGLTNKLNSSVYAQFGCKNLNAYPYYESSKTHLGITFTVNDDGSVTASGTNDGTGDSYFDMHTSSTSELNSLTLPNGNYIINGTPANSNLYSLVVRIWKDGAYVTLGQDRGSGSEFTVNGDSNYSDKADVVVRLIVKKDVALSEPVTFYPMIRPAGVADATWEPYVKSNKQLTDGLASVESGLNNKLDIQRNNVIARSYAEAFTDYIFGNETDFYGYMPIIRKKQANGTYVSFGIIEDKFLKVTYDAQGQFISSQEATFS